MDSIHRENLLLDYIGECLFDNNWGWLFTSVEKAMLDHRSGINLLDEPLDLVAAGLILAIARHNSLDSEDLVNGITSSMLSQHFGIQVDDISKRAEVVSDALKLKDKADQYKEYDLSYVFEEFANDQAYPDEIEDENGEELEEDLIDNTEDDILDLWITVEFTFRYKKQINKDMLGQFRALIKRVIQIANREKFQEDPLELVKIKSKGKKLRVRVAAVARELNLFCALIQELDLSHKKTRVLPPQENLFTPTQMYVRFMEQFELLNLDRKTFNSIEEIQKELENFNSKTNAQNQEERSLSPESKATIDAIHAFTLHKSKSLAITKTILQDFPNCIEAYICLAGWEKNADSRIRILETALRAGERTLDIESVDEKKTWWVDHHTRPYMRAMRFMAEDLLVVGKKEEGIDLLWELLEMDANDSQANREVLMGFCVVHRIWIEVREVLKRFPNDQSLTFIYGEVIYYYYTLGRKAKTRKSLLRAYRRNKYPMQLLSGSTEYPEETGYYQPGDKVEATQVLDILLACFEKDDKLIDWFFDTLIQSGLWHDDRFENRNPSGSDNDNLPFLHKISDN